MIPETRERAEEVLTGEQLDYAAEYVRRWRNWSPKQHEAARSEVIATLRHSAVARAIAGAVLRAHAPIKMKSNALCGKCRMEWPTAEDAWVCYSSGEHRAPINEVR